MADPSEQHLNERQDEAVRHVFGPLLVLAPVGTGKTTVIARRTAHAIEAGIDPSGILCLSFTNRAAREMKDRIVARLGRQAADVHVSTFHGLCAHVLRHEADALGLAPDYTICDEEDAKELLEDLVGEFGLRSAGSEGLGGRLYSFLENVSLASLDGDEDVEALFARFTHDDRGGCLAPACFKPQALIDRYLQHLAAHDLVDFTGLIANVARLFREHPARLEKWRRVYQWVQVDEVQDTNGPEYGIIALLATGHRNLAFFGDVDQTIYEWRGSDPRSVLGRFREEFGPAREIVLTRNYRSARRVLEACESFIRRLDTAVTRRLEADSTADGSLCVRGAASSTEEAEWIAGTIGELRRRHGLRNRDIAVLARTNATAAEVSRVLARRRIAHFVIENLKFFRRPEVKDATAVVRVLLNRHDAGSLMRLLRRVPGGLRPETLAAVRRLPVEAGLRITDFVDPLTFSYGDPYGLLLERLEQGRLVVFDVEATGLDVNRDEIVELAALRAGAGGVSGRFHAFLRPSLSVGPSAAIHGFTDEFLAREGQDPPGVLADFLRFAGDAVVVGHNVRYDLAILHSQCRRLGIDCPRFAACDTLDIARRFYRLRRYTLAHLCKELDLSVQPSHRAADDVAATWRLLEHLLDPMRRSKAVRENLVVRLRDEFRAWAERFGGWRDCLEAERPILLLERILEESGLRRHWEGQPDGPRRKASLLELSYLFERYDDAHLSPREALVRLAGITSLGNEADRYIEQEDKVLVLTAHQAKGLEFDTVFIAGATDQEFPTWHSRRDGRIDEEHRLFYVALSRARNRVFVSWSQADARGRERTASRFLAMIPEHLRRPV
jgi:DNA helicase-2/ATP-dependent DNA helicase PcrA